MPPRNKLLMGVLSSLLITKAAWAAVYFTGSGSYSPPSSVNTTNLSVGQRITLANGSMSISIRDDTPSNVFKPHFNCHGSTQGNGTRFSSGNPDYQFEFFVNGSRVDCRAGSNSFYYSSVSGRNHTSTMSTRLDLIKVGSSNNASSIRYPSFTICSRNGALGNVTDCWRGQSGGLRAYYPSGSSSATIIAPQAPNITSNNIFNVQEGNINAATITATDADNDPLIFSITGGTDQARFDIDSSTGELQFKITPDYEQPHDSDVDNSYKVTVQVSDGSATDSQTLTITITDDSSDNDDDADGLTNDQEAQLGTNPLNPDSDGDGVNDKVEVGNDLNNPINTDGDKKINALDPNDDNDQIKSLYESAKTQRDSDQDGIPDYLDTDDDGDGLLTTYESPDADGNKNPSDALDTDLDGIPNYLDNDDDGDGTLTQQENADPNNNQQPEDALDTDLDGTPDYLDATLDILLLKLKAVLEGALLSDGSMRSELHTFSWFPRTQPYASRTMAYQGNETVSNHVLNMTGNDAPVDWVLVELRDPNDKSKVLKTLAAIVQSDSNIVDPQTGEPALTITGMPSQPYYISIRHRNHLGVMTQTTRTLSNQATTIKFHSNTIDLFGTHPRQENSQLNIHMLKAGNTNGDGQIIASGRNNDLSPVLQSVKHASQSQGDMSAQVEGYLDTDLSLDGYTSVMGKNNDINFIVSAPKAHPNNNQKSYNFMVKEQLP